MASDIERKREYLRSLYPNPTWAKQVNQMPDYQVIAVYLDKKAKETKNSQQTADKKRKREDPQDERLF